MNLLRGRRVVVAQKDEDRLSDGLLYDVPDEVGEGLWLVVSNRDNDLLLVFDPCLVVLCRVELLDDSLGQPEGRTEAHFPVVGERCGEAEDSLLCQRDQTAESSAAQAQQVVLDHVLCLIDDEDLVVAVTHPTLGVPEVGDSNGPGLVEQGKLLLNLVRYNRGGDVDDNSVCPSFVQFKTARGNQQEYECLSCCWWCDSDTGGFYAAQTPRRHEYLSRICSVEGGLRCDPVA